MKNDNHLLRSLRLFDVVSIIVGIIIGSAIFQIPGSIAGLLGSGTWILLIWLLGGLFAFIGALCYAELASAYPREGGDYFFLHHAYGSWASFLYAWGRIWVIHSGNIAMMAWLAGTYGAKLLPFPHAATVYAVAAVIVLTALNCIGLKEGKWTQNILATTQIIGLSAMVLAAFFLVPSNQLSLTPNFHFDFTFGQFFLAFIFVQITFGGWSDAAFVAAEVYQPEKNIFRSLMTGLAIVTVIYVLINAALLFALGANGMASNPDTMATVMSQGLGPFGTQFMALVIVVCALGSVNGMILVGGRIYHPFGRDHALFHFLGQWNPKSSVPLAAFLMQGVVACILLTWGTFEQLVIFTSSAHWLFMAMVGVTLFIFRIREPLTDRPFRVPLYPILPILYIGTCVVLLYSSFNYASSITPYGAWIGFALVLTGLPVYWISNKMEKK